MTEALEPLAVVAPLPASRRHQIADWLREQIVKGGLAPGAQLKQDVLAAHLSTSPGPVREALRQLESEGLVHHIPNRGAFVATVSADELLGVLLPVRLSIEQFAVEKASLDPAVLAELQRLVALMDDAAAADDLDLLNELDVLFHESIVKSAHSEHAMQLWASVQPRIRMQIHRLARRHDSPFAIPEEHRALLHAITTGGPDVRRSALHDHIVASARELLAVAEPD
ncbi:GntR family transcriptional regulator [Mycolicibacterium nivoides]|uniref:GntR family transcriptional regulator n=1 Tax=Mycolicibacterium nivoides TaxID=2487344 RepID=UPI0008BDA3BA|nr:GntR family transcriptional regulator [Mycolicibacterium nivoides]MBN3509393.1 GntR family transcriptional regulator [Mycolicibacterium septicum]QRY45097.1 GntR family transcriptional regulator [Mycolicibacterium boenickei]SER40492.1 DNA-binding transcriptional regulator, GntR family [Mycobacterium sp. 88mf]SFG06452.1 DNA-binding transcriptional regulator, GntR family [Mycobacterium sp. 455mf]